MKALVLIGKKRGSEIPECLYIGLDGIKLQETAKAACLSGKYSCLGKMVNPGIVPLPTIPVGAHAPLTHSQPEPKSKK